MCESNECHATQFAGWGDSSFMAHRNNPDRLGASPIRTTLTGSNTVAVISRSDPVLHVSTVGHASAYDGEDTFQHTAS